MIKSLGNALSPNTLRQVTLERFKSFLQVLFWDRQPGNEPTSDPKPELP